MSTPITVRHTEISDSLRERASTVLDRLDQITPRPLEGRVVFDVEGDTCIAEIRLLVPRGDVMVATGEGPDHRSALDRAEEKTRRQLERAVDRWRGTRKPTSDKV